MKHYLYMTTIIILSLQVILPTPIIAQSNETVLVVYNISSGEQATYVKSFINDIIMEGASCSSINITMYHKGLIHAYSHVIVINLADRVVDEILQNDLLNYKGRILRVENGSNKGLAPSSKYIIANNDKVLDAKSMQFDLVYDIDNIDEYKSKTARRTVLSELFGTKRSQIGLYVKIDYVYPISDFNLISEMGDYLRQKNVPFVFVAMPFYLNTDSQAAKNYGSLLKYLIECGGTPIIHCPVFAQISEGDMPLPDEVIEKLNIALSNLATLNIFPTAIDMPNAYLSRPDFQDVLDCFSHYFAVEGTGAGVYTVSGGTPFPALKDELSMYVTLNKSVYEITLPNIIANKDHEIENFDRESFLTKVAFLANSKYDNYAISLPSWLKIEKFKDIVDGMKNKNIQFLNFEYGIQSVHLGANNISNQYGVLTYNGGLSVASTKAEESATPMEKGSVTDVKGFLKRGNLFVFLFSSIALLILSRAFLVGKIKDKKKFLRRR